MQQDEREGFWTSWRVTAAAALATAVLVHCEVRELRQQVRDADAISREASRRATQAAEEAAEALRQAREANR